MPTHALMATIGERARSSDSLFSLQQRVSLLARATTTGTSPVPIAAASAFAGGSPLSRGVGRTAGVTEFDGSSIGGVFQEDECVPQAHQGSEHDSSRSNWQGAGQYHRQYGGDGNQRNQQPSQMT